MRNVEMSKPHLELMSLYRTVRGRIDPDVLARAQSRALAPVSAEGGTVPFDKESARKAVALFLQSRPDGAMAKQVMERLRAQEDAPPARAHAPAQPKPAARASAPKKRRGFFSWLYE